MQWLIKKLFLSLLAIHVVGLSLEVQADCAQLPKKIEEYELSLKTLYERLGVLVDHTYDEIQGWDKAFATLEGRPVQIDKGHFDFVRELALDLDDQGSQIEDSSRPLEDQFSRYVDETVQCSPELETVAVLLSEYIVDHIVESVGFVSEISNIVFKWHDEWRKFEGKDSEITFPRGTFIKVGALARDKIHLGRFYIKENGDFVLKKIREFRQKLEVSSLEGRLL
ncbi:MAG: hypothetical protein KDD61_15780 [Bdellovibrionales bacterium]|nr:hypothetical protein [Bdellovibrionales bacterium]